MYINIIDGMSLGWTSTQQCRTEKYLIKIKGI